MGQKLALPPYGGEGLGRHLTKSTGLRPTSPCQVPTSSIQPFCHNKDGPKIWGRAPSPFWTGGAWSPSNTVAWAEATPHTKCYLDPCSRLAATHGPKIGGGCAPLGQGELGPHLTQCGQRRNLPACQVSSWSVQPFGHSARTSQTDRQRSDSIGRTVLQTVAQKLTTITNY